MPVRAQLRPERKSEIARAEALLYPWKFYRGLCCSIVTCLTGSLLPGRVKPGQQHWTTALWACPTDRTALSVPAILRHSLTSLAGCVSAIAIIQSPPTLGNFHTWGVKHELAWLPWHGRLPALMPGSTLQINIIAPPFAVRSKISQTISPPIMLRIQAGRQKPDLPDIQHLLVRPGNTHT